MSAPLVLTVPHDLGQAEATRRLKAGIGNVGRDFGALKVEEARWEENVMVFRIAALAQTVSGSVHVFEKEVRLELQLPWLLRKIADRFMPRIRQQAKILLEPPSDKTTGR